MRNRATRPGGAGRVLFVLCILATLPLSGEEPASTSGGEWPRWRGPTGQGIASDEQLPAQWPTEPLRLVWETAIGGGWSSPVVSAGRVVITDRQGMSERTIAFDASTGRELWVRTHPVDFDPHAVGRRHGNGPKSTPLIDRGRVYSLGIAGWLECYDLATGQSLWHVHLPAEYGERQPLADQRAWVNAEENVIVPIGNGLGAPVPLFGYTGSLTAAGDRIIVPVGGAKGGTLQAFDCSTGRVLWRALHEHVSYSSPIVAVIHDRPQVVYMTGPRVVGLDLADGRLLWSHPFQVQYDESISTPVVSGDRVIVAGDSHPAVALRISRSGDSWQAQPAWENFEASSYLSSFVVREGHLYGLGAGGSFVAVRIADGQTLWSGGDHGFYGTPLLAGRRLLALNERGLLAVVGAEPDRFQELGQSRLSESATWTSPALVGRRFYVRGYQQLRVLEIP